jgi:hypothetical protein
MNDITKTTTFCSQQGRKGISYDWQTMYAAAEAATLDSQLAALTPAHAE